MKRKKIEPKTKKTIQRNKDKGNNKTVNCRRLLLLLLLMPKTMILCSGFEVLATKSRISSENNVFFFRSSQKYRLFCVICLLIGSFIYRPTVRSSVCFSMSKQKSSFIRLCCAVFDSVVSSEHMSILHFDAPYSIETFDTLTYKHRLQHRLPRDEKRETRENSKTHSTLQRVKNKIKVNVSVFANPKLTILACRDS